MLVLKENQIELTNKEADLRNKYEKKLDEKNVLIENNEKLKETYKIYMNLKITFMV